MAYALSRLDNKKGKDYTFRRPFNEKQSMMLGCLGSGQQTS
jgi:hypothetical protein